VAKSELEEKVVDYVQDAHAMEDNIVLMLNSMIMSTSDRSTQRVLQRHLEETRQHAQRLHERLQALGEGSSVRKETQNLPATLLKGMVDQVRTDKAGKNARDGFVTEHLEIAAYELLERMADRAGDKETAAVARRNRRDEEAMARRIESNWDKVVDLSLAEAGIKVPRRSTGRDGAARSRRAAGSASGRTASRARGSRTSRTRPSSTGRRSASARPRSTG
jgi:ferritin-like metal-binding protein YciE